MYRECYEKIFNGMREFKSFLPAHTSYWTRMEKQVTLDRSEKAYRSKCKLIILELESGVGACQGRRRKGEGRRHGRKPVSLSLGPKSKSNRNWRFLVIRNEEQRAQSWCPVRVISEDKPRSHTAWEFLRWTLQTELPFNCLLFKLWLTASHFREGGGGGTLWVVVVVKEYIWDGMMGGHFGPNSKTIMFCI